MWDLMHRPLRETMREKEYAGFDASSSARDDAGREGNPLIKNYFTKPLDGEMLNGLGGITDG